MIEEGEYIRTNDGYIGKYLYEEEDGQRFNMFEDNEGKWITSQKNIKAHSRNIIDLIEIGDYVNGFKVDEIHDFPNGTSRVICNKYVGERQSFPDEGIRSIVTKEQFLSVAYIR